MSCVICFTFPAKRFATRFCEPPPSRYFSQCVSSDASVGHESTSARISGSSYSTVIETRGTCLLPIRVSKVGGSSFTGCILRTLRAGFCDSHRSLCFSASCLSVPRIRCSLTRLHRRSIDSNSQNDAGVSFRTFQMSRFGTAGASSHVLIKDSQEPCQAEASLGAGKPWSRQALEQASLGKAEVSRSERDQR